MGNKTKKLSSVVGELAPKLGKVLGFFGVPGAEAGGDLLGKLGKKFGMPDPQPDKLAERIAQDPDASLKLKEFELEHDVEINKIIANMTVALDQEVTKRAADVNDTMKAELATDDKFKSYWRPFNGYILGIECLLFTVSIIILAFIAVINKDADAYLMLPNLVLAFSVIVGTHAAVVGVSAHSRGQEKLAKMGMQKPGMLQSLVAGFKK
ncbi:MAG: hypothetical protein KAS32_16100 [Candidatus Peribacteraceae bacterium]|nr:hypothetical protein [Candidatus Peribacteraceae bacterium]